MYSNKETKSATKAQKKTLKKKQQQQQQQLPNGNKVKTPTNAKNSQPNINNNNNHSNINNNNSHIVPNNNSKNSTSAPINTTQKFREAYQAERRNQGLIMGATTLPGYESVPKMERSNSFSLRNKFSKFINHLTGSKENISKVDDDVDSGRTPFLFTRSRSMIQMRRPNRRSFIEPQLEQLSEETEKSGDLTSPASPRKTSVADLQDNSPVLLRRTELTSSVRTPKRRQSAQPFTSTPLEELQPPVQRKASLLSLNHTEPANNPQLNFQKRRSNTLIASFKSTFSGLTGSSGGAEKKEKMNPKWSASLQSLQAIDNMVSYANMSFIDYDKFNGYEKQLERQQSLMSLAEQPLPTATQLPLPPSALAHHSHSHSSSPLGETLPRTPVPLGSSLEESVRTVVRRRKRSSKTSLDGRSKTSLEGRSSMASLNSAYNLDTDYEHNLDRVHNVYRESLDSRTLELLNLRTRNSFILDQAVLFDALNLEDGSVGRRCALCSQRVGRSGSMRQHQQQQQRERDAVDGQGNPKKQLKSKSLTHLDGLDSGVVACQHGPPGIATTTTTTTTAAGTTHAIHATNVNHHGLFATTGTPGSLGRQPNVVSSSEFFSVSFCLDSSQQQHPDEEFIPATKGVTLLNALSHALRRRNISFSQITITDNNPTPSFLDAGPSPVPVSVDEQTDVESLAGHHLCITERGSNRKPLQKAASFGSRQPPPRLLPSVSTEETSESGVAAGKQIKQRWSSIFGIKNPQQSQLCELLNSYGRNGVPQRADGLNFEHPDLVNSLAYLQDMHKSWRDFVESSTMSESEVKIQTAIWELVTTEVYYIHALQTVTDLFLACLEAVQEERLLIDVDQARLFSNVRAVCEANIKFWTLWLYPMVAHSVITHEPLRCAFFQEGFIAFASIFAPYKIYCAEQSTCQFYCKELNQNNPLFTSYLAWCESQKMCNRLRLADIVVRPMQRLTKYSLLLAAIKKHMSDVEEIEAIDVMIHSVENFVGSVNNHLTMRQENERLKGVMVRIESYDVVDTNNEMLDKLIKQHSQMFDLCAPMRGCPSYHVRHLFMEGDHKFKDNLGKSDVHCFLLTDLLLVCKTIAKRGLGALKVIRQPYLTDQLIVQLAANNTLNCVYLNEFQVATTAFTLQCTEAKNWYDALWRAKTIYQRLKRGAGGVGGISGGGGGGSGSGTVGGDSFRFGGSGTSGGTSGGTADSLGVRKSPMNSSIGSHVSSANNSHSGSVEWNDSRNISVDFEKTNSVSSDEGSSIMTGNHGVTLKGKQQLISGLHKAKMGMIGPMGSKSANTLSVQPMNHLGQSLPNLNMHHSHTVPLRRGMAFSTSTKNPPLRKTRNVTSQNSINWHQIPATPTPPSPRSQHQSPGNVVCMQKSLPLLVPSEGGPGPSPPPLLHKQLSHQAPLPTSNSHHNQSSTETDV
ncbi:pleckstrin homology domain-containing family G member 5 isoform X6 [Drosophila kikkawai]|uniref:Pleckstrin homology domain-containing family G member 5 isoform X6 n=1 Tax=Drosophila kikkawai TaxID=30033 RepID=A0A6P4I3J5_DROKI|nr:pleckstrin homology domain-containing family G member 5 isoform X1 [Drosophila kikkawai]XP_017022714.1 pleckstrin homology domain-containing family G member 5 isoform X1 [Drosophila kikkawai]XP_017022715.1 pleckstrin homology domain-containing family G member 5 isoform X1 [Drosophila kikkawai]XP_041631154.1 pleckstrin homology domain-containing family G member 5 isoform X1 [Drosophila kikkawai]